MRVHSAKPSWQAGHDLGWECALADKLHWFSVACYQSAVLASVAAGSEQSAGRLHRGLASLGLCRPRDGPSRAIPWSCRPAAQGYSGLRWCRTPAPSPAVGAVQSVPLGFIFLTMVTFQATVSTAPAPQPLNIISSSGEELNCLSCVLPEDLLVDILSERLKVRGVGEKETFLLQRDRQ